MLEEYNNLWLRSNVGRLRFSDVALMRLEIRLARLVILRADLGMRRFISQNIINTDDTYFSQRATSFTAWRSGNLFYGPADSARLAKPTKTVRIEYEAAKNLISSEWADRALELNNNIETFFGNKKKATFKDSPWVQLEQVISFCDRLLRLMAETNAEKLWARTGQGFCPASPSQYNVTFNEPSLQDIVGSIERAERTLSYGSRG